MTCLKSAAGWLLLGLLCLGGAGCMPTDRASGGEEDDPDFQAGLSHKRSNRPLRAVESFERALQRNPRSVSAHFELGLMYYEGVSNYVAALYHFDRVQRLDPNFKYNPMIEQMIRGCKQEFIRDIPVGTITLQMQQDLQRLQRLEQESVQLRQENLQLRQQVDQLLVNFATAPATPKPGVREAPRLSHASAAGSNLLRPSGTGTTTSLGGPTHVVEKGDTVYSIARRHGLRTEALLAANPSVNPQRIVPGQVLRIPPR
jgi:LysM repeat protein